MQALIENKKVTYGFYCPISNKFYYVENKEIYMELLTALGQTDKTQNKSEDQCWESKAQR